MQDYTIRIDNFEGPLELLLELIKKREMNIYDLQISQITKDYMESINVSKGMNIDITAEFLEMASMLLEIKAKMLLPVEVKKDDPRNELIKQLLDYQQYKRSVEKMKELKEFETRFFKREIKEKVKKEMKGTVKDLIKSYQMIFAEKFKTKHSPYDDLAEELSRFKYTIEDRMEHLQNILTENSLQVDDYFRSINDKEEIVVTFGALLELIKNQIINITILDDKFYLELK